MNQLSKPSLALLALLSTLAALPINALRSEPGLLAQVTAEPTPTFDLRESVAPGTSVSIDGSSSMAGINQSLAERFEQRYPNTDVVHDVSDDAQALRALGGGNIDLAALGRALSDDELDTNLTSIPVTREKIAIIVGRDNPFRGDLTFDDFAAIFRGEISNWSQVGGPNLPIRFVDRPAESDTRRALADYEIFSDQPFETGDNAVQVDTDDTAAVVRELGNDGISYAIASEVLEQDAVRPVSLDTTLPDDDRYPYSQPRNYIYQGEPSEPVEAFLGFATSEEGQAAIAEAKQIASDNVTVGANKLPGGVAVSPDGRFMVRGTEDGQLEWLDAEGNPTDTVVDNAHRGAVSTVVVSPDGQTVVSSGADGTLRRWDRNGNPLGQPLAGQGGPILALALSPDGQTVASGTANGTVERWSLADGSPLGEPIAAHDGPVRALHYPAGGQALITGSSDGSLGFWNADGTPSSRIAAAHQGGVTAITSSPDGQVLTTTGSDGTLRSWDRSTLQPRGGAIQAHDGAVSAVAYSPDGSSLATAGADSTLQLWAADGTPRLAEPVQLDEPAASLGYTPEGRLVVGRSDRNVELRDDQGERVTGADPAADPAAAPEPEATAADSDSFWQRIRNLPPSAWWMLAVIPAVLLLIGIVGSLFGGKDDDDETATAAADRPPGPGAGMDSSGMGGRLPVTAGPLPPGVLPEVDRVPPEAELVSGSAAYPGGAAPSKLEQARTDMAEGRRLMREGHCDTALIYFNQAVEATEVERSKAETTGIPAQGINAIAAQAQAQRGNALAMLGQANEAIDSYNAALQIDSSAIEAWIGKGNLLSTMARYDEAIFCFDTALELDPAATAAWTGKGQALMQMGRQSEGQTCLDRAAALGSDDPSLGLPRFDPAPGPYLGASGLGASGLGASGPGTSGPGTSGPGISGPDNWLPTGLEAPEIALAPGELPQVEAPGYAPSGGYDPDVPLELQQMVLGLPSADVEISGSTSATTEDVPPALTAEAARLPGQAEDAMALVDGAVAPESPPLSPESESSGGITPGPLPPMSLEDELLSQVYLSGVADANAVPNMEPSSEPNSEPEGRSADHNRATAPADIIPPLRPAPVSVPPPVTLEPGDYIPPPPTEPSAALIDDDDDLSGLEGLPPEVLAAMASIPPSSPDSFGVVPAAADAAIAPAPATAAKSWIRLSVDRESDRFYALWNVDQDDRTQAKNQGGETMTLRLYDVTGRATQTPLPSAVAEQRCRDDFAQDWYLPIPQWDRIYVVEVGYLSARGDWQAIAQSAEVAAITT